MIAAFNQDDADRRRHDIGTVLALDRLGGAGGAVRQAQMRAGDARHLRGVRQCRRTGFDALKSCRSVSASVEADRPGDSTRPFTFAAHDFSQGARGVAEMRGRAPGPIGRIVEPREIRRAGRDRWIVDLVERQEFRLGLRRDRDVAAAAAKSRHAQTFGNVLMQMPVIELIAPFGRDVVPDDDRPSASQCHSQSR